MEHPAAPGIDVVTPETPGRLLDCMFRSRMISAFGISDRVGEWQRNVRDAARRAIAEYKRMLPILTGGDVYHVLPQPLLFVPRLAPREQWEAIEHFHPDLQRGVILVFRARAHESRCRVPVRGVDAARHDSIRQANTASVETRPGRDWLRSDLTIELPSADS